MKKSEIIVPDRLFNDVNRIEKDTHTGGMTFYRVERRGKIKAKPVAIDRGTRQFTPEFVPRIKIEVVVEDHQVDGIVSKIIYKLANPEIGGKIFVVDVPLAIDLATNEHREKEKLCNRERTTILFWVPLTSKNIAKAPYYGTMNQFVRKSAWRPNRVAALCTKSVS